FVYSTYLGGENYDYGYAIAVDRAGSAYVTGFGGSNDFPTVNAFQPSFGGDSDAFVTKFAPEGNALVYSSYLGGSGEEAGEGIAVDQVGNATVVGVTSSSNFPTLKPLQPGYAGGGDAFVTKVSRFAVDTVVPKPV